MSNASLIPARARNNTSSRDHTLEGNFNRLAQVTRGRDNSPAKSLPFASAPKLPFDDAVGILILIPVHKQKSVIALLQSMYPLQLRSHPDHSHWRGGAGFEPMHTRSQFHNLSMQIHAIQTARYFGSFL